MKKTPFSSQRKKKRPPKKIRVAVSVVKHGSGGSLRWHVHLEGWGDWSPFLTKREAIECAEGLCANPPDLSRAEPYVPTPWKGRVCGVWRPPEWHAARAAELAARMAVRRARKRAAENRGAGGVPPG